MILFFQNPSPIARNESSPRLSGAIEVPDCMKIFKYPFSGRKVVSGREIGFSVVE
jgi:hypothetical protein